MYTEIFNEYKLIQVLLEINFEPNFPPSGIILLRLYQKTAYREAVQKHCMKHL